MANPLSFSIQNVTKYTLLSSVSRVFLSPLPTSIASEWKFKIVKLNEKNWLSHGPENSEILVFMKYNLRAIEYGFGPSPNPSGFILSNAMCCKEAKPRSGHSSDVEDELDSV